MTKSSSPRDKRVYLVLPPPSTERNGITKLSFSTVLRTRAFRRHIYRLEVPTATWPATVSDISDGCPRTRGTRDRRRTWRTIFWATGTSCQSDCKTERKTVRTGVRTGVVAAAPGEQCENGAGRDDPLDGGPTEMGVHVRERRVGVLDDKKNVEFSPPGAGRVTAAARNYLIVIRPHKGQHRTDAAIRQRDDGQREYDGQRDVALRFFRFFACGIFER